MEVVNQLASVALGSILTLLTALLVNRQSSRNALALARNQRLLNLRQQAVRDVREAVNAAERLHIMDRTKMTLGMFIEMRQQIIGPIIEACDAFGLDTEDEEMENLTESFYEMLETLGSEVEFRKAIGYFIPNLLAYRDRIRDAWKLTLEGKHVAEWLEI